ncbi:5'-3' exoribonuclease 2 homolog [Dermacentor silvarum]|uniref:5'-3' exoribonuclease 2 homolog n=1 Tax=Dermacentor silvarum TaxID=543639 RepID=UPI00210132AC|nr:5'-3' exoribonuclease 2 homolog [Dermacentor silvarum]
MANVGESRKTAGLSVAPRPPGYPGVVIGAHGRVREATSPHWCPLGAAPFADLKRQQRGRLRTKMERGLLKWVTTRYPSIITTIAEEKPCVDGRKDDPGDNNNPSQTSTNFDNLFLDLGYILRTCTNPDHKPAPNSENQIMKDIFDYIDRVFKIVRPRRLLYMALDGVAPRARMNEERSRRFKGAQESEQRATKEASLRSALEERGERLPPECPDFDANCIMPGTDFMERVTKSLHFYIHQRLNCDDSWKDVQVVLSDSKVPGEGKQKIMDFIRTQKGRPNYDPNTKHCIYGPDADLIMMGLVMHAANITIMKEDHRFDIKFCRLCQQTGHDMDRCEGLPDDRQEQAPTPEVPLAFVHINVLRDQLARDLRVHDAPFPFDQERAIADWVFLCLIVENDFLPNLPSLSVSENAVERLENIYKETLCKLKGYLTEDGRVQLTRFEALMNELAKSEEDIFWRRRRNAVNAAAIEREKQQLKVDADKEEREAFSTDERMADVDDELISGQSAKRFLSDESLDEEEEDTDDEVRLWEPGWRQRYYVAKFDVTSDNDTFRHHLACEYTKGLCWVLRYYVQGSGSWKWFFPYLYGPFASDFVDVADIAIDFDQETEPLKPMEQLMCVLPVTSSRHLPEPLADLMEGPKSPIIDFYPKNFNIDPNGHKFNRQGVALLPFVEERRLLEVLHVVYPLLDANECG